MVAILTRGTCGMTEASALQKATTWTADLGADGSLRHTDLAAALASALEPAACMSAEEAKEAAEAALNSLTLNSLRELQAFGRPADDVFAATARV